MLLSVHTPPEMRKNIQTPDSSLGEEFSTAFHEDVPDFPKPWKLVVVAWQILGGFPIRRRPCPELGARKWLVSWMLRGISVVAMGNALFANYTSCVTVNFQLGEGAYLKNALSRVSLLIMTLSSLPCILHGLLSARRLSRFINTLLLLIRELQPANQPVWPLGWVVRTSATAGALALLFTASCASHMETVPGPVEPGMISVPLNLATPLLLELQYFLLSCVIGLGFERLSENIKALFMPSVSPSAGWVEAARRSHEQLVSLSVTLHQLLGPQLLVVVLACRLSLLAVVYVLASDVLAAAAIGLKRPLRLMRDQMLVTVSYLLRFLLICAAGSVIKVRASEVVEHSFRVNALTWGASSKAKWILLLHQLDTVRPTTTFGGLDVGLGLMLSLFATTTTYLLVLLQFEK